MVTSLLLSTVSAISFQHTDILIQRASIRTFAHTHDDRYYTETEVGNLCGYNAISGYNKSNWDNVYTAFNAMQVGGRNLLISSGVEVSNKLRAMSRKSPVFCISIIRRVYLVTAMVILFPEKHTVVVDWTPAPNVTRLNWLSFPVDTRMPEL